MRAVKRITTTVALFVGLVALVEAAKKKAKGEEEAAAAPSGGFIETILSMHYVKFLMWQGNGALEVSLFGYLFHLAALKLRKMNDDRKAANQGDMSIFQGVFRLLMLAFGGGTIVPICLGMRPFPFACDVAVPMAFLCYYLALYMPGDLLFKTWQHNKVVQSLFWFLFEVVRANVIILWLKRGHVALEPWKGGQYYPVPVVGPIMAGAFSGCFGGFIHNGLLACVDQGVPWLVQSSFYLCIYYHLCVFDPYVKPVVQGLIGAGLSDASYIEVVHVLGVLWLIVMALLQALVFGPAWNPFAPIHDALYNIAGVPRITKDAPAPTTKGKGKSKKN